MASSSSRRDRPHRGRHSPVTRPAPGNLRCLSREHPARRYSPQRRPGEMDPKSPLWASGAGTEALTDSAPLHPSVPEGPPRPPSPGRMPISATVSTPVHRPPLPIMARLGKREGDRPRRAPPPQHPAGVGLLPPTGESADTTGIWVFIMNGGERPPQLFRPIPKDGVHHHVRLRAPGPSPGRQG